MAKNKKTKAQKNYNVLLITIILAVSLTAFVLYVLPQVLYALNGEDNDAESDFVIENQVTESFENQVSESVESQETVEDLVALAFPMQAEEGKLEIESVFQFEGINPDCNRQSGESISAITLRNISDAYLKSAKISAVFADGSEHTFLVQELPAGKTVMAFSVENLQLPENFVCVDIHTECVFEEMQSDASIVSKVDAMSVTLSNVTDKDLSDINVYCRDVFDDKYFGGITYMYTIDKIPAGGTETIMASDSMMGVIDVVRIAVND